MFKPSSVQAEVEYSNKKYQEVEMKTKITLIVDAIFAFIWLNIFVRGLYTISSASGVTMSKALKVLKQKKQVQKK